MSINEINPGSGLETGVDTSTGLPGSTEINRDLFGQPLSKAPKALGSLPNPLGAEQDGFDGGAVHDDINAQARSHSSFVYGDEFESGITPIDRAAHQVGKVLDAVDRTVEESTPVVRQLISETVAQISEATHEGIDTARRNWNAPDNELRTALSDRLQRGVGFLRRWATNLSENHDVRELMDNAIMLGRNLAEKTGDAIQNAQVATESWLDKTYNETYAGNFGASSQIGDRHDLDRPFVGVIDTGFKAQDHGTQVMNVIQQTGHHPDWLSDRVGSSTWSESLVNFVDAAKAADRTNAVINLSFDLTQINPDGSISTRFALTTAEGEALQYAQANGVLVVVSAGNQNGAMSALGQASQEFDNVIAVGATEGEQRADYSSYGAGLDLVASGQVASGQEKADVEGTSLAAARVTGSIARIWNANPQLNYHQVMQTLESTAIDLQQPGWDQETGFGRLNSAAAIALAEDLASQPQTFSSRSTSQQTDNHQDSSNNLVEHKSLTWQNSQGAIASERPNRLLVGDGISPEPASNVTPPSSGAPPLDHLLKYEPGASLQYDEQVKQWQQRMQERGWNITVDGLYGRQSAEIARQFQQEQGLTADGIVGSATWAATFDSSQSSAADQHRESEPSPYQGMSADAAERWSEAEQNRESERSPYQGMSADAAEHWSEADQNRQVYAIQAGDTLSAIAQRNLGDSSQWTAIEKADGSRFTEAEASNLQVGEVVYLPAVEEPSQYQGMSADAATRWSENEPSPYQGMSPDAAERWIEADRKQNGFTEQTEADPLLQQDQIPLVASVEQMSSTEKLGEAFERSISRLDDEAGAKLRELITPENIAIMAGTMAVWAASHGTPVGWLVDGALIGVGLFTMGTEIIEVAKDIYHFAKGSLDAKTEADLDEAGQHLAEAISSVGIDLVVGLLTRKALGSRADDAPDSSSSPDVGAPSHSPNPPEINSPSSPLGAREDPVLLDQPDPMGTHRGASSGRAYSPDEIGVPPSDLSTARLQIRTNGIDRVEQHLSRFGDDPQNQAQIQRLRDIAAGRLEPTEADLNFYAHELRESVHYRRLGYEDQRTGEVWQPTDSDQAYDLWNNAHTAALEDYGLREGPGVLYHPSVEGGDSVTRPLGGRGPSAIDARSLLPADAAAEDITRLQSILDRHPEYLELSSRARTKSGKEEILDWVRAIRENPEQPPNSYSTQPDLPDILNSSLDIIKFPYGSTAEARRLPGVVTGGDRLPDVTGRWFEDGRVGLIPGQIARQMKGMHFDNFRQFRETFWKLVAQDPYLGVAWEDNPNSWFSYDDLNEMEKGAAPLAHLSQRTGSGSNAVYQLDHSHDLQYGGGVYDLDSIRVVTPRFHQEYGRTPK